MIACATSSAWNVEVIVADKLTSTTKALNIPMAFTLMDFYYTGKGIAVGKVATRDGFDCAMAAYFSGGVTIDGKTINDYVVEQSTWAIPATGAAAASTWYVTKWASGLCELHARVLFSNVSATSAWGSMYTGLLTGSSITYPVTFAALPACIVSPSYSNSNCWIATGDAVGTTTYCPQYQVVRPTSATVTVALNYYVRGYLAT